MNVRQIVQQILEAVGVVESPAKQVRRKLRLLSQAQPQGRVTLSVTDIGSRENSAISVLREVTDFPLRDVLAFIRLLPAPLLTDVSPEVAEATAVLLRKRGIQVTISGLNTTQPAAAQPAAPQPGRKRFATRPGGYAVTLVAVGLLGERVLSGVRQMVDRPIDGVAALEALLPLQLLDGVDQETAVRAQVLLQMVGAVVDIDERPANLAKGL